MTTSESTRNIPETTDYSTSTSTTTGAASTNPTDASDSANKTPNTAEPQEEPQEPKKSFVIAPDIPPSYPGVIPGFSDLIADKSESCLSGNHLILPTIVLRAINPFKGKKNTERGYGTRRFTRSLFDLLQHHNPNTDPLHSLKNPIHLGDEHGTTFSMLSTSGFTRSDEFEFEPHDEDVAGQVILAALYAQKHLPKDTEITIITNDNHLATRAWAKGIPSTTYDRPAPPLYSGRRITEIPYDTFNNFYKFRKPIPLTEWLLVAPNEPPLVANEFVRLTCATYYEEYSPNGNLTSLARFDAHSRSLVPLRHADRLPYGIRPRNDGQAMMAELIMLPAEEIPFVIIRGTYGTGKTFLATALSMYQCEEGTYDQILIVPPDHHLGEQKGFLPGELDDKMLPEIQPFIDSLRAIRKLRGQNVDKKAKKNGNGDHGENGTGDASSNPTKPRHIIDKDLMRDFDSHFSIIPILYARGRNLADQLVICDEFQNLDRIQADVLLGRIATGSKLLILGDPFQFHGRKYSTPTNNGLSYAAQLLHDDPLVGQVYLTETEVERSDAARLIARRLKAKTITPDQP